jgi:cell division protein FtsX
MRDKVVVALVAALVAIGGACGSESTAEPDDGLADLCDELLLSDINVIIWFDSDASDHQVDQVRDELATRTELRDIQFLDQSATMVEFGELFEEIPEVTDAVEPDMLSPSLRFTTDPDVADHIVASYQDAPGVLRVTAGSAFHWDPCARDDSPLVVSEPGFAGAHVRVYLDPNQLDRTDAVRATIEQLDGLVALEYISQDVTLEEFTCLFPDHSDRFGDVDPRLLPPSFRLTFEDAHPIESAATELPEVPGTMRVTVSSHAFFSPAQRPPTLFDCEVTGEQLR